MKHVLVLVALFFCVTLFTFSTGALAAPVPGDVDLSASVDAVDAVDVQTAINAALGM